MADQAHGSEESLLRRRTRLSPSGSRRRLLAMARLSDVGGRFRSAEVIRHFEQHGASFDELVEKHRDPDPPLPFENLVSLGAMRAEVGGNGAGISLQHTASGEEIAKITGPGLFIWSAYVHSFETAVEALDRAIERASAGDLHTALVHGVASVEGYLNQERPMAGIG